MATDIIARGMAAEAEKTANKYKAGANIVFTENADGTVAIEASGEVSSEDTVARNLINNHKEDTGNPHGVTAEQIGLGNVDNTSDLEKPISNAMQDALDKKVDSNNLGTAAYKDVPIDGDASDSQVVLGNDSRLSDSRKADGGNAATLETHPASDFVLSSDFEAHAGNAEIHVTSAEKAAWSAVNYSNPNLLINPDFAVNQRGQASYSASGYTVDRWKIGDANLTVNDGFVTLENTMGKGTTLYQIVENPAALSGKTVVLSFDYDLKTEGAWISVQAITNGSWNPSPPVHITEIGRSVKSTVITLPENLTELRLALVIHSTDSAPFAVADIYGAKLELGKIATPIVPADPATELAKCQRYYQIRSTNDIDPVDLRPSMRATPTDIKQVTGGYAYVAEL